MELAIGFAAVATPVALVVAVA